MSIFSECRPPTSRSAAQLSFKRGIMMAESTLMFAAAIIAGSSDAVLGHLALHQPPSGIAPAHCGQRSNRLDPGAGAGV